METMTPKEKIDAVIKHQAVDRTPFTVVDGGAWIAKTEGVTYRELYSRPDSGASSVVDYLNKIDSDMISAVSGVFTACLNAFGCPISIDKIGGAIDTGSVFKDPINEIPQLNRETIRDTLLANDFVQKMINQTRHVKVLVGNQKYIFGDIAGPFTMAAVMVGTSDFIMLMLEEPEIVHELLDFTVCRFKYNQNTPFITLDVKHAYSNIFPVETGLPSSFGQRLHFQRPHELPHGHSRIKAIRASSSPLIKILLKVWMQI